MIQSWGQKTFFVKDETANSFSFVEMLCHTVSVATIQLHCYSTKTAIHNMPIRKHGCMPIKYHLQKGMAAEFGPLAIICRTLMQTML